MCVYIYIFMYIKHAPHESSPKFFLPTELSFGAQSSGRISTLVPSRAHIRVEAQEIVDFLSQRLLER